MSGAVAFGAAPLCVASATAGRAGHMSLGATAGAGDYLGSFAFAAGDIARAVAVGALVIAAVSAPGAPVALEAAAALAIGAANLFVAIAKVALAVAVVTELAF